MPNKTSSEQANADEIAAHEKAVGMTQKDRLAVKIVTGHRLKNVVALMNFVMARFDGVVTARVSHDDECACVRKNAELDWCNCEIVVVTFDLSHAKVLKPMTVNHVAEKIENERMSGGSDEHDRIGEHS